MKKLLSVSLALILTGGLLLADNTRAEAMNHGSAALVAASILLGLPLIWAMTHDHYGPPAPVCSTPYEGYRYPRQRTVIYTAPTYERHHRQYWGRSYAYDRGSGERRGYREYQRGRNDDKGRYSQRRERRYDN